MRNPSPGTTEVAIRLSVKRNDGLLEKFELNEFSLIKVVSQYDSSFESHNVH